MPIDMLRYHLLSFAIMTTTETNSKWLSLEEAASYLKMGRTVLYTLARQGQIPASRLGKKWAFEKDLLDQWARSRRSIRTFFTDIDFNIESNVALREPQRDGYLRAVDFFKAGKNKAIIQLPVGCGKSGLAAILPMGIAQGRVLILAPNLTIKDTLFEAMDITNRPKCFWRKTRVLAPEAMTAGPLACTLETGNVSIAEKCHIVITNIQQLAASVEKWLHQFPDDFFDVIIVDEAHHSAASSWKLVLERFPKAKVIHMTATPFRSDRQEIDGELIYRYPFRSAMLKGYIKRLKASYVAPSKVHLSFSDQEKRVYSLDDVMKLKEEEWFSKGVALAKPCNEHIVENSLQKLEDLRLTGTKHQLIAVACSINHAKDIRALYRERGYASDIIHSKQEPAEQERVLAELKNGTLDCIIQVQMLGEGFDHPKLSVAAIFRPFRTLAPYVQFVGRIMRVVVQGDPAHPDNMGHIVTHLGMNLDQRLKEFKQFENDDEAFWNSVIGGEEPEVPRDVADGTARRTVSESGVVITDEIVDSLWEEDFDTAETGHVIAELQDKLRALGLDPAEAERIVKASRTGKMRRKAPSERFPVLPQKEWEEAKKRVHDQANRIANILLNNVGLQMTGREIPYKYTSLGVRAKNNYVAALMMVNNEFYKRLKKDREQCTTEEFQALLDQQTLAGILQGLVRQVKKAQANHDSNKT